MTGSGATAATERDDRKPAVIPAAADTPGGAKEATPETGWSEASEIVAEFTRLAEALDAAGLGPADYLYAPLKWRLEHADENERPLRASAGRVWRLLADPPPFPRCPGQAGILMASSYSVSADFLRKVLNAFDPVEAVLCDASGSRQGGSNLLSDRLNVLAGLLPAMIFALRVDRALRWAGAAAVDRRRIADAALTHRLYRRAARAVLRQSKPECVVIANGNRPFEFALFAEAKAKGLATVLLPFAELNPKPARFLSLCRGGFDLALPFSEQSAQEIRKLRNDAAIEVVGFPNGGRAAECEDPAKAGARSGGDALYICGNNFEDESAAMLREAFAEAPHLTLRVRLHPRNDATEMRKLFGFVAPEQISDPDETPLADDIAAADMVIMVRSTVALDAMFAGRPLIWLSPPQHRAQFDDHPIRKQGLALYDVSTPEELRAVVQKLAGDPKERQRAAEEQWARLCAAGYRSGYYEAVRAALRRLVDWGPAPKTAGPQAAATET